MSSDQSIRRWMMPGLLESIRLRSPPLPYLSLWQRRLQSSPPMPSIFPRPCLRSGKQDVGRNTCKMHAEVAEFFFGKRLEVIMQSARPLTVPAVPIVNFCRKNTNMASSASIEQKLEAILECPLTIHRSYIFKHIKKLVLQIF